MPTASDLLKVTLAPYKHIRVIGIDPGETTGVCVFQGPDLIHQTQLSTGLMPTAAHEVKRYILEHVTDDNCNYIKPHSDIHVVVEDYRVYSWKADEHSWAGLHTPRLIGALEYICSDFDDEYGVAYSLSKQSAQNAKGFCTDQRLQDWGLYIRGQKHSRDAIRHAVYHLLFDVAQIHKSNSNTKTGA